MLEISSIHGRQYFCLLFLVGMLLHFATNPSLSSKLNMTSCNENDRAFLLDIIPQCKTHYNNSFLLDCCSWPGISCSNLTGRIIGLDLSAILYSSLCGEEFMVIREPSLPSLDDLASLWLDLDVVSFNKGLPSFIRSFPNLRHLYLSTYDGLEKVIPQELGNLTKLETLEVTLYNSMYASTLSMLSRLTSLKRLVLNSVSLSKATDWLQVVSNLPHLEHLDLRGCSLPNVIRPSQLIVNSSKSLVYLDLSYNYLESSPSWSWIFNHSSLISLFISNNQLNGLIPNRFREMRSLAHLDLSHNRLEGRLPTSLGSCCGLRSLDVSQNHHLQGDLSSIFLSLTCASESLTVISLHKNLFSGSLPDFTMFSFLNKLSVHSNRLNGSLPSFFKRPSRLAIFDVHSNQLTGPIPDLSVFRSLKVLQFQNNRLIGMIHPNIGQLSMLRHLDISSNALEGHLGINHFANLSSLRYFDISSNSFKGDLGRSHLANLTSLRYLDISSNSLTLNVGSNWVPPFRLETIGLASCGLGSLFPEWLRTQTDYIRLDLSNSGISGTIPFWFWNLSSVASFISLSHNRLHGKLPTDLSILFNVNPAIDLSFNFLDGTIPSFFGKISYLNLSRNRFSGPVSFLCTDSLKLGIDLSHNNLSGELPDCWSEFDLMSVLDLSNNSFSGQLPSSLANLSSLQSLHLRKNKFSGKLPLSLCNLTYLMYLDVGDNLFSGEMPGCLGHMLSNLTVLSLRNNSFSGSIPPEFCHPSIQILDLSMNNISGVIPKCLCKLQAMTQKKSLPVVMDDSNGTFSTIGAYKDYISLVLKGYLYNDANHLELVKSLDLSGNNLRGSIPGEISCLTGLISLNFSGNNLSGSITSKIGSLNSLESLDLSNNHLSGQIPSTVSDLNFLGTLNLANNNFSGRIPSGTQIQGFNASAFAGNPWLCGEPLSNKCPGDEDGKGPSINEDHQNPKDNAFDLGLYISVVLGFITSFWAFCGVLVIKRSWRIAYFRAWIHAYDKLYVVVTLMLGRIQRRHLA